MSGAEGDELVPRPVAIGNWLWRSWVGPLWIALGIPRAIALSFGLDRLPLLPTVSDEVITNDPALALSRGLGLVAFSLPHSPIGLGRIYAHFPPIFIFIQTLVFRVFGFGAITLRASSVVFDLAASVVFLAILSKLYEYGIIDEFAAALGGILVLLEPATLRHARNGRMESLVILLGGLAFYWALRASREERHATGLWLAAAAATGLALATHLAAVIAWVAFCGWTILHFRQLRWKRWISVNAVPPMVLCAVWIATYGAKAGEALRQQRKEVAAFAPPPSLLVERLIDLIRERTVTGNDLVLMVSLPLTMLVLAIGCWRVFAALRDGRGWPGRPVDWWPILVCLCGILLAQCALIQFVVPSSGPGNRQVLVVPFALVCLAVAVSHLAKPLRRWMIAAFVLIAAMQVGVTAAYLGQLRNHWADRTAERFATLVNAIPADATVVGTPELWFAFRSRDRQFDLKYGDSGENDYWNDTPGAFDPYDVAILDADDTDAVLLKRVRVGRPIERVIRTYPNRTFVLFARASVRLGD